MQWKTYEDAKEYLNGLKVPGTLIPRALQACGFDADGEPLVVDGVVGRKTKGGRFLVPSGAESELVETAYAYLLAGARETHGNNRGPWIAHFFGRDPEAELNGPAQWCAAFVSTCLRETFSGVKNCWGARKLTDRLVAEAPLCARDLDELEQGQVIAWERRQKGFSYAGHIGIIAHVDSNGDIFVIEGNAGTNGRVRMWRYYGRDSYARHGVDPVWRVCEPEDVYPLQGDDEDDEDYAELIEDMADAGLPVQG